MLLLLSAATLCGWAQPPDSRPRGEGRNEEDEAILYLNLSPEQKEKLRQLRNIRDQETGPLRMQERERNAELRLLWLQLRPDPAKVKLKLRQIQELKGQIQEKDVDHWFSFRNLLTEEQLSRFLSLAGDRILRQDSPRPPPRQEQNPDSRNRPEQPE